MYTSKEHDSMPSSSDDDTSNRDDRSSITPSPYNVDSERQSLLNRSSNPQLNSPFIDHNNNTNDSDDDGDDDGNNNPDESSADYNDPSCPWTKTELYIAWLSIFLLSNTMALSNQTLTVYANYATSSFNRQSLLSTIQVVSGILNVVTRPVIAKIADVIGRFEGFVLSFFLLSISFAVMAVSPNIEVYFLSQILFTVGQLGVQFMIQVFAADTTNLVYRAIFVVLPNVAYIFVPWLAGPLTSAVLETSTWRWGLAMWAAILPISAVPLLLVLLYKKIQIKRSVATHRGTYTRLQPRRILGQLDLIGSSILTIGLSFVFIGIPLASDENVGWTRPHVLAMLIIGTFCLLIFPLYERKIPTSPLISMDMFKKVEITKTFVLVILYCLAFYIYNPYFFSWLIVVFNMSNTAASNVSVVYAVTATLGAMACAVLIRYAKRLKWFLVSGTIIGLIGVSLIYHYRTLGSKIWQLVFGQLVDGVGSGFITGPAQVLVQSHSDESEVAQTTAVFLSSLALGQVIGDALSGAVYRGQYAKFLREQFPHGNDSWIFSVVNDMREPLKYPIGSVVRSRIIEAFNEVMRILLIPPLVLFGILVIFGLTFKEVRLDKEYDVDNSRTDEGYEPIFT